MDNGWASKHGQGPFQGPGGLDNGLPKANAVPDCRDPVTHLHCPSLPCLPDACLPACL